MQYLSILYYPISIVYYNNNNNNNKYLLEVLNFTFFFVRNI